jgi:hypothetical protein
VRISADLGTVETWEIVNQTEMDVSLPHPEHAENGVIGEVEVR